MPPHYKAHHSLESGDQEFNTYDQFRGMYLLLKTEALNKPRHAILQNTNLCAMVYKRTSCKQPTPGRAVSVIRKTQIANADAGM